MHALYWIGAMCLLAAVLWGETPRPPHGAVIPWADFARQHGIAVEVVSLPSIGEREKRS
jgi:hypothetical protein